MPASGATTSCTSSAPGPAPPTWSGSGTPTLSWPMAETATEVAKVDPLEPLPVLAGRPGDRELNEQLFLPVWQETRRGWLALFAITSSLAGLLFLAMGYTVATGIGVWGNNVPVGWAFDIINFVWWIGIGHAGTLISAILLLFQQRWRTSINRFAEAMTLFAVAMAGMYPIIH